VIARERLAVDLLTSFMEAMARRFAQALDTSEIAFVDGAGRFHAGRPVET
jgi:hypothetical protein